VVPGSFSPKGDEKAVQMRPDYKITGPPEQNSPWPGVVKFLFLVLLIVIMFLLGQDMVRHRFFRGGWVNQRDVLKP
jgi:hypothetical protein